MKKILGCAAAMVMAATTAQADVPESDEPIKFMIGDWTSIALQAEIMQIILQTYGYNTETVAADDSG
ncbi:MAG: ABC transporter, partial [Pseudomonadota bacterium]